MKLIIHGLGRMGMQIARKLAESGEHEVIVHNRSRDKVVMAVGYGGIATETKQEAIDLFSNQPPVVWVMLPADVADEQMLEWAKAMPNGGVIISGGNSDWRKTKELNVVVKELKARLVDIGVSGGVWGYQNGFPMMCGADDRAAFEVIEPALKTLSQPGGAYQYFGSSGAGHYVKMIHNAIEYGMMQSLGEGYQMLKEGPYKDIDLAEAGRVWQHHSVITSWLNELSMIALRENPEMKDVSGYVAESGEARWALETAKEFGIDLPAIQAAFDVRLRSQKGLTSFATKVVAAQRNKFGNHNINGEGAAKNVV